MKRCQSCQNKLRYIYIGTDGVKNAVCGVHLQMAKSKGLVVRITKSFAPIPQTFKMSRWP